MSFVDYDGLSWPFGSFPLRSWPMRSWPGVGGIAAGITKLLIDAVVETAWAWDAIVETSWAYTVIVDP